MSRAKKVIERVEESVATVTATIDKKKDVHIDYGQVADPTSEEPEIEDGCEGYGEEE